MVNQTKKRSRLTESEIKNLRYENIGVKDIPTNALMPNPHNPRFLFDKEPLKELRDSIKKVGILIPLAVYWSTKHRTFIILDGQRRWICAQELGLKTVPANQLAEPNTVQNIVTMFQIHNTREDWELMPTALKLEVLMKELKERGEKKLATLTGLNQVTVSRCKKLLTYERRYQDLMLDFEPSKRMKADFFIELYSVLVDKNVKKMDWFSKNKFVDRMLFKYNNRLGIKAVTDFRKVKQHITNAVKVGMEKEISKRLETFTSDDNRSLDYLQIDYVNVSMAAKKILSDLQKMEDSIENLDTEKFYGEEDLWNTLENLLIVIKEKLREAGRRIKE